MCDHFPLFELGSCHHKQYVVNLYFTSLPLMHREEYQGFAQLNKLSLYVRQSLWQFTVKRYIRHLIGFPTSSHIYSSVGTFIEAVIFSLKKIYGLRIEALGHGRGTSHFVIFYIQSLVVSLHNVLEWSTGHVQHRRPTNFLHSRNSDPLLSTFTFVSAGDPPVPCIHKAVAAAEDCVLPPRPRGYPLVSTETGGCGHW